MKMMMMRKMMRKRRCSYSRCERVLVDVDRMDTYTPVCVYARMHSVHLGASQRKCRKICSQTASRSSLAPQTLNVQESTVSSTRNSGVRRWFWRRSPSLRRMLRMTKTFLKTRNTRRTVKRRNNPRDRHLLPCSSKSVHSGTRRYPLQI